MFDGRIILDQNWALAAISTLLDRGKTLPALNHSGRFTRTDLQHLVWHGKSDADCDTLLGMMLSYGICFIAREVTLPNGETQAQYIAPELLPPWSESLVPMFRRLLKDPDHLGFEVRYPILHDGILRGCLSRLGDHAGDHAVYWKYGCWFHEGRSDCDVFIESRWEEAGEDHSRGSITVKAWGRTPEGVLQSIHRLLQDHRTAQQPETHFINFAGFDQRGAMPPEADVALIVSAPGTRADHPENLGKQVYLSYAWGEDETEGGRRREAAARRLIERLTQAGYEVTYDLPWCMKRMR
ncbi:MAG TPA: COR domain-containing protein [Gemmataceae bacterium]|nr:COR domain-containing protein [Gemmataceae bacterium]